MPDTIPDAVRDRLAVGVRVYSKDETHLQNFTLPQVAKMVAALRGKVGKIFLSVWQAEDQPHSDFGGRRGTYVALSARYVDDPFVDVNMVDGDLFVAALNQTLALAHVEGFEYFMPLSASAYHLLTPRTIRGINMGLARGALVVDVTSPDNPITLRGASSNTCAVYHAQSLMDIGGFDKRDTRPADFDVTKHIAGVGELLNALVLGDMHGRRVLWVVVPDVVLGDVRDDDQHRKKLREKERRAEAMLTENGYDWQSLQNAMMARPLLAETIRL